MSTRRLAAICKVEDCRLEVEAARFDSPPRWKRRTERASKVPPSAGKSFCEPKIQVVCQRSDSGTFLGTVPSGEASSSGRVGCQKCHRNKGWQTAAAAFRSGGQKGKPEQNTATKKRFIAEGRWVNQ
ncbi:hypothetical protein QL285_084741 [Trifolium repens]|nr:hypothetical protein QL285_084741 [Trifolium repens]